MTEASGSTAVTKAPVTMSGSPSAGTAVFDAPTAMNQALAAQSTNGPLVAQLLDTETALEPNLGDELVTLYVGPKRKKFSIHKKLLCGSAKFFDTALNGPFVEGQEGGMHLPEDEPGAVSLYVDWLYRGSIRKGRTERHLRDLYDFYFLADKLCLVFLKDKAMDAIQDMAREYQLCLELIEEDLLEKVILRTPSGVPSHGIRAFSIFMLVWSCTTAAIKTLAESDDRQPGAETDQKISLHSDDIRFVWDLSKDDYSFFEAFFKRYEMELQDETIKPTDPRLRDEDDDQDRCFFHCHEEWDTCRPIGILSNKPPFVSLGGEETDTAVDLGRL